MRSAGRRLPMGLAALGASIALIATSASPAIAFRDRDCSNFKTQRQAQKFFKKHHGSKRHDPHRLDSDHDGIACETLPRR